MFFEVTNPTLPFTSVFLSQDVSLDIPVSNPPEKTHPFFGDEFFWFPLLSPCHFFFHIHNLPHSIGFAAQQHIFTWFSVSGRNEGLRLRQFYHFYLSIEVYWLYTSTHPFLIYPPKLLEEYERHSKYYIGGSRSRTEMAGILPTWKEKVPQQFERRKIRRSESSVMMHVDTKD